MEKTAVSEQIVRYFLLAVRSGKEPGKGRDFMADQVIAHQMNAENPQTMERTPQYYAEHVNEFLQMYGKFDCHRR